MTHKKQAVAAFDGMTLAAHVDAQGTIHIEGPFQLPAGAVWLTLEFIAPEALDADDALWAAAIAHDPEKFERLLAEAEQAIADGTVDELNPDAMLP